MSDQSTTPKTRNRFKGELTLGNVTPEAPPASASTDLTAFLEVIDRSWQLRQQNEDARKDGQTPPHAATAIGVTIPKAAASLTETRFRQAASERGIGVSTTTITADTERGKQYGLSDTQVRMIVEARPKKKAPAKRTSNGSTTTVAADTATAVVTPPADTPPANPAAGARKAAARGR